MPSALEYQIIVFNGQTAGPDTNGALTALLDEKGAEGWELASALGSLDGNCELIFKRAR